MKKLIIAVTVGLAFLFTGCPEDKQVKDEKKLEEPKDPDANKGPTVSTGDVKVEEKKEEKKK